MDNSAKRPERSPDGKLIVQLATAGSDLSKLHDFTFTLRAPTQAAAERADLQLQGFAFKTRIEPGKTAAERTIRGTKKMYPLETDLEGLREKLNAIAISTGGSYEGWTARESGRKP